MGQATDGSDTGELRVAVVPAGGEWAEEAVRRGGGRVVPPAEAQALIWVGRSDPALIKETVDEYPAVEWVQLPFAGVEKLVAAGIIDRNRTWTCAKGSFGAVVAEHALALTLALLRELPLRLRATHFGPADRGRSLKDCKVAILGAGGIAQVLLQLMAPLAPETVVVRRQPDAVPGADRTVGLDELDETLAWADVAVVTWALTPETAGLLDARRLSLLGPEGVLVNIARGGHVVTDDLVQVLTDGRLFGAGVDVTDPEPLPDDHPLFLLDNAIVTPHCANTQAMVPGCVGPRVEENVRRFIAGEALEGLVDPDLGY